MTRIRPENIYIFMYVGGCGGEFLSQLISRHPGFVQAKYDRGANTNDYHAYYDPPIQLDATAGDLKAVFPTHPFDRRDRPSKPQDGIMIPPEATWISALCDPRYRRFFFLLFCIKTELRRQPNADTSAEFREQIAQRFQRSWHYQYELAGWLENSTIPDFRAHMQQLYTNWCVGNMEIDKQNGKLHYDHSIDIGQLFFRDFAGEYAKLLNILGTQAIPGAETAVAGYHARNIALVEQHTGVNYNQLLSGSDSQVWEIIYPALVKCYRLV